MKIGAELQRKPGVACTVSVGFATGVVLNGLLVFFFLSVTHHQEALEGSPKGMGSRLRSLVKKLFCLHCMGFCDVRA